MSVVNNIPTTVAPSSKTWLGIARELVVGDPLSPLYTLPLMKNEYSPEDTPRFLPDEAIRGSMAQLYSEILGPEDATFSFGGPNFLDVHGFFFDNCFGDLSSSGTSPTNGTSLLASTTVGATTATISSITGYNNASVVQIDSGSVSEVVILDAAPSGTTITFGSYPLRFAHASGATVATVTGPYTHTFALLNSGDGQPPTHSITDYTNLTASVGARTYPSACVSAIDFTGNAENLLDIKTTGNSWISAPAGTTPTNTRPTPLTVPVATWRSTVSIGGTAVYDIGEWAVSCKRQLQVYWTAQGAQNPYIIARGGLMITGTMNFTVPSDESALLYMLNNTQPSVAIAINNGQTGSSLLSLTINLTKAAFIKSKPDRNAVLVGYQDEFEGIANTTDVGGSGGLGPGTITLVNNIPSY